MDLDKTRALEALKNAREKLSAAAFWHQKDWFDYRLVNEEREDEPEEYAVCSACVMGAIGMCWDGDYRRMEQLDAHDDLVEDMNTIAGLLWPEALRIDPTFEAVFLAGQDSGRFDRNMAAWNKMAAWNDEEGRTHVQVLELLDAAIASLPVAPAMVLA